MNILFQSKIFTICACMLMLMCMDMSIAEAEAFQSHKSIYQAAQNYMRGHLASQYDHAPVIKAGKLDARLKLKKCNKSLQAFLPKGSRQIGKTTVGVKCTGSKPWSLHVPVTVSIYKDVLVAAKTLLKGDVLSTADIKLAKHNLAALPYGYFDNKKDGVGMKIERQVQAGAVLTPAMLKKPLLITRGQKIAIMARSGLMEVRMMGKALENGAIGDRIRVMNLKSKQKLEGVVISSTEVEMSI